MPIVRATVRVVSESRRRALVIRHGAINLIGDLIRVEK